MNLNRDPNAIFKELGNIYYRERENDFEIVRIIGIQNSETVKIKYMDTGKVFKVSIKELKENFGVLISDLIISFSIVKVCSKENGATIPDVMVLVYKRDELDNGGVETPYGNLILPYCVCRQSITDIFYNYFKTGGESDKDLVGLSVTRDSCPANIEFTDLTYCSELVKSVAVNVYKTDTLDDILSMIDTTEMDNVLSDMMIKHHTYNLNYVPFTPPIISGNEYEGYCKNLKTLLEINSFAYDMYTSMNITKVSFEILTMDDNGNTSLVPDQIRKLSDLYRININKTIVAKYEFDIDLDKIQMNYMLIMDSTDTLYIIAYTSDGEYIETDLEVRSVQDDMLKIAKSVDYYNKYR